MADEDRIDGPPEEPDDLDEDTAPDTSDEIQSENRTSAPRRNVRIFDFKDGRTRTTVNHGPADPSRVWAALETEDSSLHVSLEEGTARQLWTQLGLVLASFRAVRSDLSNRRPVR
jgi:hypothetical protein